ncbi:epoxide hydrolase, partial [Sphingomonadaceae bacterium G21617-S1]|nr:epoxide hydrolase [Sphingomonadaceae bacterium G21617-S1]
PTIALKSELKSGPSRPREGDSQRRRTAWLNGFGQFRTTIDGLNFHFLHIRSKETGALPLLMTHGWPGSVIEFNKVIGPLVDPVAHGGDARDAFHLVLPSLPGYGFSEKPASKGWNVSRIARAWVTLMGRLGYERYVAQGGDWGSAVTTELAIQRPSECLAIHLNLAIVHPTEEQRRDPTPAESEALKAMADLQRDGTGYLAIQATRPQTVGYGLVDSPAAQAAWIYDKYHAWIDHQNGPEDVLSLDDMLDNIMMYWLPATGASSARLYWECIATAFEQRIVEMPVGISVFPKELLRPSRRWADGIYKNVIHWNELDRGGHFAAFEQPELFVDELRTCFRSLR